MAQVHVRAWQVAYRGLLPDDYLDGLRAEDRMARYTFGSAAPRPSLDPRGHRGRCGVRLRHHRPLPRPRCSRRGRGPGALRRPPVVGTGGGAPSDGTGTYSLAGAGFTEALLWVLVGNERAQRFYRLDGWEADDTRRRVEVWGIAVDEIRYRRRLP